MLWIIYFIVMAGLALHFDKDYYHWMGFEERIFCMMFWPVILVLYPALIAMVISLVYIIDFLLYIGAKRREI